MTIQTGTSLLGKACQAIVIALLMLLIAALAHAGETKEIKYKIHGRPANRKAVERLMEESLDGGEVWAEGTIAQVKGRFRISEGRPVEEAVIDFIGRHGDAFGLSDPEDELKPVDKNIDKTGRVHISYQQTYNNVPVWRRSITALVEGREITLIEGKYVPTPELDTNPRVTVAEAVETALLDRGLSPGRYNASLNAVLVILSDGGEDAGPRLAYSVTLFVESRRWDYNIDAKTGKIINSVRS